MIAFLISLQVDSLVHQWVNIADSVLNMKIDEKRIEILEEKQLYARIFNIYLPPVEGGFINKTHLGRISRYLIKERHVYVQPVEIGNFFYLKFSGLWDSLLIKEGSIRLKGDTLYVRFHIPRELDYIKFARWNIMLIRGRIANLTAGIGFQDAQLEVTTGGRNLYRAFFPVVLRKDISAERFRKLLMDTYKSLSDSTLNDSTFMGVNLGGKIFRYTIISVKMSSEKDIYRYGRVDITAVK